MAKVTRRPKPKFLYEISIAVTDDGTARGATTTTNAGSIRECMELDPSPMETLALQLGYGGDIDEKPSITALSFSIRQVGA